MGTFKLTCSCAVLAILVAPFGIRAADAPATQPDVVVPATKPAGPVAAPTTKPAAAGAEARHKDFDPRWRQINENLRNNNKRWAEAPVTQTVALDALIHLSLKDGLLQVDTADLGISAQARVAVEGSKAVWTLSRTRAGVNNNIAAARVNSFVRVDRFDFDAGDEEIWNSRAMIGDRFTNFFAQSLYGNITLSQNATGVMLRASELAQWGQPQRVLCSIQTKTLMQLRLEHPEEFRLYAVPILARFSGLQFLRPGSADVYSVFVEIPADQMIAQSIAQLLPQLDADDPTDRDAASTKLRLLGDAGVLAALRWDVTDLSEEQKLRLESFIFGFRRRAVVEPTVRRRDVAFLLDSLEYNDPAVRAAAKAELEKQTGHPIVFDPALTGGEAAKVVDQLRTLLLSPPPPPATQPTAPATQPAPQA